MNDLSFENSLAELVELASVPFTTIKPSEWAEANRSMDSSVSRFKGRFSYDVTPYMREIVDCLSPDHPARIIGFMKGAQIGGSVGLIESGTGWIISQQPGNILFLTGHADLAEEAITKIDNMIDSCSIRYLIRPSVKRARGMKTGDTNTKKEFPGGSLASGSAGNHKLLRQRSVMYGFIDDFDAAKSSTKESGSTRKMIEQRFASYSDKMKLFYISTPELKQNSNIEPVYLLGDQRKYHIPCPCCGEFIPLEWSTPLKGNDKDMAGMTWRVDDRNKLIPESVGYICQQCGGFFNDELKHELNLAGFWKPTAEPSMQGYYSYHISSLYAPPGMYDWEHYVRQYMEANPPGEKVNEHLQKTFVNLCLGETWEAAGESLNANALQKNIRNYDIGTIPEKLSEKDGNGKIVLLTCACDLNGKLEDARLDYEVLAWSESGATYSVTHGSIGTFIPNESNKKNKAERETWSYENHKPNNVWTEFDKILSSVYLTDTGRKMKIVISGIDTGYCELQAFTYIDRSNLNVVGLKGDKEDEYSRFGVELPNFKIGQSRSNLYLLRVGQIKDDIAAMIGLKWDSGNDMVQPAGFMNFPTPSQGKYLLKNYFSHFESEKRILDKKNNFIWQKVSAIAQNHFFDVRVYNIAVKDILLNKIFKEYKIKSYTWKDFCYLILKR
jgi:phage terminase large subunit GpA-like protein